MGKAKRIKLTKTLIDKMQPGLKEIVVGDSEVPGLQLRILPTGNKVFRIEYKAPRRRYLTIGSCGQITVEQARLAAKKHFGQVVVGIDPQLQRQKDRLLGRTFVEFAEEYMAQPKVRGYVAFRMYSRWIKYHINPRLGRLPLASITRDDIEKLHAEITDGVIRYKKQPGDRNHKTAGGPVVANKVKKLLTTMFNHAITKGYLGEKDINPCRKIELNPEKARQRRLLDEEHPAIFKAIFASDCSLVEKVIIFHFWSLAKRHTELRTALLDDLDLKAGTLVLRDTKNDSDDTLFLTELDIALFKLLPRAPDNPYIYQGKRGFPVKPLYEAWYKILDLAGLPRDLWIHDFRRRKTDQLQDLGISIDVASKLLNHSDMKTTTKHYGQRAYKARKKANDEFVEAELLQAGSVALITAALLGDSDALKTIKGPGDPSAPSSGRRATQKHRHADT